jgi:ketosteroid isomerase-like protein
VRTILLIPAIFLAFFSLGCGAKHIPGLAIEVEDTPDNRALVQLVEAFRQAFERKDIDALVGMASPRFFENAGNNDAADDYNYDGLREHFGEHFKQIEKVTLDVHLRDVVVSGETAYVDYRFVTRYLMKLPAGDKWKVTDDVNRMNLAKEDGNWKVISGM